MHLGLNLDIILAQTSFPLKPNATGLKEVVTLEEAVNFEEVVALKEVFTL